jgi:hypothetical protein
MGTNSSSMLKAGMSSISPRLLSLAFQNESLTTAPIDCPSRHYPPFNRYNSSQYLNWQHKIDLAGESLRSRGVKKFIKLANSHPLDNRSSSGRKALYGDIYSGLHYNNDLVKRWSVPYC